MNNRQIIGLDVGKAKIGVARANLMAAIAEPLLVVSNTNANQQLADIIDKYQPVAVVIGIPRNLNGQLTAQSKWVNDWVSKYQQTIKIPIYRQDETLTTVKANENKSKFKDWQQEDAEAAAIILQDFLNSPTGQSLRVDRQDQKR